MLNLWLQNVDLLNEYSQRLVEDCFFSIRVNMMLKVLNRINIENRLSKYDEKIFDYFNHIMTYYTKTIGMYEDNKDNITNSRVKEIFEGICNILRSQVDENQKQEYVIEGRNIYRNPVVIEREQIISTIKQELLSCIEKIKEDYFTDNLLVCSNYVAKEFFKQEDIVLSYSETLKEIYMGIVSTNKDKLYQLYKEITISSVKRLNNLQYRKAVNFYYESIRQEKDKLETIVKVQVEALEQVFIECNDEIDESSKQVRDSFVEAYQRLGKEIEDFEVCFKEAEAKEIELPCQEEFFAYLIEYGNKRQDDIVQSKKVPSFLLDISKEMCSLKEQFKAYMHKNVEQWVEELLSSNSSEAIKTVEFDKFKLNITQDFLALFKEINLFYEQNKEKLLETPFNEIFKGIYETIDIKLQSLAESEEIFIEEMKTLENSDCSEKIEVDIESITQNNVDNWYEEELPMTYEQTAQGIEKLKDLVKDCEQVTEFYEKVQKAQQQKEEALNKKYSKFLKEHLLFELTTYEEVLNYSVSRLRQEENIEIVKEFVSMIDNVNQRLDALLIKYSIEPIKPEPHSAFDGKQHEVLMAEKNDEFEKGQIIKIMNTGYRYNGSVIIRANVIAAR